MATMSVEASMFTLGVTMGAAETLVVWLAVLVAVLLSPSCMGRSRHPSSGAMRWGSVLFQAIVGRHALQRATPSRR